MKKIRLSFAVAAICGTAALPAHAGVIFNFNYTDVGVGFNDPTYGTARQNALESAANYLAGFLTSYNANIILDVDGSVTNNDTLAAASSNFNSSGTPGFGNRGDIMIKILNGDAADPNPAAADGTVTWNFEDFQWELGNDFQPGEYDFFSTAVHELLHALGFSSDISKDGSDAFPGTPDDKWSPFDQYVADAAGNKIIDPATFSLDAARWAAASVSSDGTGTPGCGAGLTFVGPNATAANGGNPVELYAPNPWEDGSSGSHLDDQCYGGTYMMEAATDAGLSVRTISAVEIGIMKDIGYAQFGAQQTGGTGGNVPAPSVLYLLALGLGLMRLTAGKPKAA